MFRFLDRNRCPDMQRSDFQPCIGVIETYDMKEARLLIRKRRDALLSAVCTDDIGLVERGLAAGAGTLGIYVRYSVWAHVHRYLEARYGSGAGCVSIDVGSPYNGSYAYYSRSEVEAIVETMTPARIHPACIPEKEAQHVCGERPDGCWLCGSRKDLSLQDMLPWQFPYMAVSHGRDPYDEPYDPYVDLGMMQVLCGPCLRAWRARFDARIRTGGCHAFADEYGIERFDRVVMGGSQGDEDGSIMAAFRDAVRKETMKYRSDNAID